MSKSYFMHISQLGANLWFGFGVLFVGVSFFFFFVMVYKKLRKNITRDQSFTYLAVKKIFPSQNS